MTLNPIQLEVLWNRLLSVANEQQTTLIRTAFSTIVRESLDLACGVFDTRGYMIGQSLTGTPGHINPMATGAIHLLNALLDDVEIVGVELNPVHIKVMKKYFPEMVVEEPAALVNRGRVAADRTAVHHEMAIVFLPKTAATIKMMTTSFR